MRRSLELLVLVFLSGCTANFCTRSVIVPASKFGSCNVSELSGVMDGGGGIAIVYFPDVAACETAETQSCSSQDSATINDNINCLSEENSHLPSCAAGEELVWPAEYFQAACPSPGSPSPTCAAAVGLP